MMFPVIFILAFAIIVWQVQKWSVENALKGIQYNREASKTVCAPGEIFQLITTVTNTSRRIIPYIEVDERLEDLRHNFKAYLMPRSRLVRRVEVSLLNRGRYTFPQALVSAGDFLGLSERRERFHTMGEVVIYPQEAEGDYLDHVMGSLLGDISVKRFIAPDPILVMGFSEYTGREPMKAISWPQTLRSGQMMVKNYDYTTELSATVVLSVDCLTGTMLPEGAVGQIEKCLSIARTVCSTLEKRKIKYDFYSNITASGKVGGWSYVREGYGKRHFTYILEGLGRAALFKFESFERLVRRVAKGQTYAADKAIIFIAPNNKDKVAQIIKQAGKEIKSATIIVAEQM